MALSKPLYQVSLISLLIALTAACKNETPSAPAEETPPSAATVEGMPNDKLDTDTTLARSYSEGVPGSAVTAVETLTATVVEIDRERRLVVLEDEAGHRRQVQARPEAANFDQIEVGDRVRAIAAVETVVSVRQPGTAVEEDAAAQTAESERSAAFATERTEVTATIESIDSESRMATLTFPDGSSRTVPVRDDVVIRQEYVGNEVVIVITSAIASRIEKLETAPAN